MDAAVRALRALFWPRQRGEHAMSRSLRAAAVAMLAGLVAFADAFLDLPAVVVVGSLALLTAAVAIGGIVQARRGQVELAEL